MEESPPVNFRPAVGGFRPLVESPVVAASAVRQGNGLDTADAGRLALNGGERCRWFPLDKSGPHLREMRAGPGSARRVALRT